MTTKDQRHSPERRVHERREEIRSDRKQMDMFAGIANGVYLFFALAKSQNGKVDFDDISRLSYLSAKSMMRHRRDFGRGYSDEGEQ